MLLTASRRPIRPTEPSRAGCKVLAVMALSWSGLRAAFVRCNAAFGNNHRREITQWVPTRRCPRLRVVMLLLLLLLLRLP